MLLERKFVCSRLCLSTQQSYRLFPSVKWIHAEEVVTLLNRSAVATPDEIKGVWIPSDLVVADTLSSSLKRTSGILATRKDVMHWTKKIKNPVPHYRINSHHVLFSVSKVEEWMASFGKKPKTQTRTQTRRGA